MRLSSLYGVLGSPISRSSSAHLFNEYFKKHSIDALYLPLDCDTLRFSHIMPAVKHAFSGVNVTSPLKREIYRECTSHDEASSVTGSVNVVKISMGKLEGYNSDPAGFRYLIDSNGVEVSGKSIAVLGSGGASASVAYALRRWYTPGSVAIVSRRAGKIDGSLTDYANLRERYDVLISTIPYQHQESFLSQFEMVIGRIRPAVVIDIVYNPKVTLFMRAAALSGIRTVGGTDMFLGQASTAFDLWFKRKADMEELREILLSGE